MHQFCGELSIANCICYGESRHLCSAQAGNQVTFTVENSEKGTVATDVKVQVPAEEERWCSANEMFVFQHKWTNILTKITNQIVKWDHKFDFLRTKGGFLRILTGTGGLLLWRNQALQSRRMPSVLQHVFEIPTQSEALEEPDSEDT